MKKCFFEWSAFYVFFLNPSQYTGRYNRTWKRLFSRKDDIAATVRWLSTLNYLSMVYMFCTLDLEIISENCLDKNYFRLLKTI